MANEKRLIDADVLFEEIKRIYNHYDRSYYQCIHDFFNAIRRSIRRCTTVDAVEVVRCKDCKHWHEETGWCYHHSHFIGADGEACHPWESGSWKMLNEDDFCSYGERKDDA